VAYESNNLADGKTVATVEINSAEEIKGNEEELQSVERDEAAIENKASHQGFRDAKRRIDLADEEECLGRTLRHEQERQANDKG
jgi:hypothetical protein